MSAAVNEPTPIAYDVAGAARAVGVGITVMREQLRIGNIRRHYVGSKPLILHTDLVAWVAALPATPPRETDATS